jgi:ATP-dependent Clp protease, protease subunit
VNATPRSPLSSVFDQPWWAPRSDGHTSASRNGFGLDDNVYQSLLQNRIIFLGSEVKDENANAICAQMLLLNAEDPHKDIYLYINSPGGSVDSGMAIYDTMKWISNDVATVAIGLAASMGQFLLCAGEKGKRFALPHSRIMMHQPSGGLGGTASDIRIQAEQSLHIKSTMQKLIAEHTGQTLDQIEADSDRDRWFTAEQALAYGFIDHVFATASQIPSAQAPNQ